MQTAGFKCAELVLVFLTFTSTGIAVEVSRIEPSTPGYRMPVDLVAIDSILITGNSRTGSISVIDLKTGQATDEWKVGSSISSIEHIGDHLVISDETDHCIRLLTLPEAGVPPKCIHEMTTAPYPVEITVSPDQLTVAVACLWSRTVVLFDYSGTSLTQRHSVALPFAPRRLLFLNDQQLTVADSFGGQLAILDATTGSIRNDQSVYGHNIRGLAINPNTRSLMVTCQTLEPGTFTSYERIFWGVVMQNGLHSLPLESLTNANVSAQADARIEEPEYDGSSYASRQRYPLGTPSIGSGDPGAMVVTSDDTTLLLISGTNQLAFRTASHMPFERLRVGRRPESICLNADESTAFIANRFDGTITVVSLRKEAPKIEQTISLGPQRALTPAEEGEQIFYDASVSLDGWFSCHSCHTDGHTNGLMADTFGDEDRGAPKRVISLLGTGDSGPWAWTGNKTHLEEQIKTSLIISMQSQTPTEQLPVGSLAAFLRSLPPAPPIRETVIADDEKQQLILARREFETVGCTNCHSGPALTSAESWDVGLQDEMGETRFNPPSLRGVSQRSPWFHDGSAKTLEEVLKSSHHDQDHPLTDEQIRRLGLLLETL